MAQEPINREAVVKRLRRIEGQVRGIQRMVEEERDCESVVVQLAAVRSAIEGVGALVLNNYMKLCFSTCNGSGPSSEAIESLTRAMGIWGRVRVGEGT